MPMLASVAIKVLRLYTEVQIYLSIYLSNASHLRTHQLTHTREKSYQYETCLKTFSRAGVLTIHQLTHTREKS